MRILYINPFRSTGYGVAGTGYVKSLVASGYDVVCRRLDLGDSSPPSSFIQSLEQKPLEGVTHVVYHTLPSHYHYDARFINVGLFAWETDTLPAQWVRPLQMMDGIVCINPFQQDVLKKQVSKPSTWVPHACDEALYQLRREIFPPLLPFKERGECLFYAIGEWTRRKNWATLLRAFHLAFRPTDSARLVLKTSLPGQSPAETKTLVEKFCEDIYVGMRVGHPSRRRKEVILTEPLDEESLFQLHSTGDIYVSTSHGEAFNLGCMEAMATGNAVVVPRENFGCPVRQIRDGYRVAGRWESCFGAAEAPAGLYPATSKWFCVDVDELAMSLRSMFDNPDKTRKFGQNAQQDIGKFSYHTVGNNLGSFLQGLNRD